MRRSAYKYRRQSSSNFLGGIFSILLLVGLAFLAWKFYPLFLNPLYGKFDRFNVAVAGDQVALVSLNISDKSMVVINVPSDLYLPNVVHGYGQYKAASVYAAGNLDHRGGETLAGTLQDYLGVPVDGYFFSPKKFSDPKNVFLSPDFIFGTTSNISFLDKIQFVINLFKVRFDKVKTVDLGDYASPLVLADGSSALTLEPAEVDQILAGLLVEDRPQTENFRVEVVNTTSVTGLGARASRVLANIGLSVINVESAESTTNSCLVLATRPALKSVTVARIAQIYSCKVSQKPTEDRADITVKLGQTYADFLTK